MHRFPFQFNFPSELPVSFEGMFGYIRYKLTATMESSLQSNDILTEPVTILRAIDANRPDMQVNSLHLMISSNEFETEIFFYFRTNLE